ncbi:SET domain-containing protein [Daedalea quercina L-15889]|uniref:SET domain-containing protein n=1 Tax=Daedalea quercina L-15889 TaxID=1314783 RepID=A0A165U7L4_9APHY|nr:SET domain-containing protein [Daedalea quercina L-15889]
MIMIGSRAELEQIIPFGEVALQKSLPHFEEGLFRVAQTEQKGLGMFATRFIKAGELIVAERPTVVSSKTLHGTKHDVPYAPSFYDAALAALSEPARASLMALDDCCSLGARAHLLPGRIMTNGYTCGPMTDKCDSDSDRGPVLFSATYPTLPRANHDCAANAHYSWNGVRWCGQFYAARDIRAGDEITTKYVLDTTQAERHASFERRYSCRCLCKTCLDASPEDVIRSDERRRAVAQLLRTLETALDPAAYPMLSERSVRRTLGYAREEGMMFQYARILWEVGRIMQVQENPLVGFEWAKEARKAHVLLLGEEYWLVAKADDTGEFLAERLRARGFSCTWP